MAVADWAEAVALPGPARRRWRRSSRWCGAHDVPLVPRGGGTRLRGRARFRDGGVVLGFERMARCARSTRCSWRMRAWRPGLRDGRGAAAGAGERAALPARSRARRRSRRSAATSRPTRAGRTRFKYGVTGAG
ncbi:MAG: hypothetical protein WKG07_36030 [Hymenobacter sp.]